MTKYIPFILIIVIGIAAFAFSGLFQSEAENLDSFAECLTDKGIAMYGADWCPHCQDEKKNFGSAFKLVNYIECGRNPQSCLAMGVEGFPTWIFPDGKRLVGEQGIEKLSEESGCVIEKEQ